MLHVDMRFFPNMHVRKKSHVDMRKSHVDMRKSHVDIDIQKFHVNMRFFSEHVIFFEHAVWKKIACSEKIACCCLHLDMQLLMLMMMPFNCSYQHAIVF